MCVHKVVSLSLEVSGRATELPGVRVALRSTNTLQILSSTSLC